MSQVPVKLLWGWRSWMLPSEGQIVFMGNELSALKAKEMKQFRKDLQIVFQDPYGSLSPRMTVSQIIGEGLRIHSPELDELREIALSEMR